MPEQLTISVLVERDGDWWVAQCLQINLATQARTLQELHGEIRRIIFAHLETCAEYKIDPFKTRAPERVWDKYQATKVATSIIQVENDSTEQFGSFEIRIAA